MVGGHQRDPDRLAGDPARAMLIHLDTDLGGDTDDACALALLLGQAGVELAGQPEYRRLRLLAKQAGKYNQPPFVVARRSGRAVACCGGGCDLR